MQVLQSFPDVIIWKLHLLPILFLILSSLLGSFLLLFGLHLLLLLVSIFFVLERVDVRVCADFKLGLASLFDVVLVIEEI